MNLSEGDEVVGMQMNTQGESLLIVSENGMGKRTALEEFTPQKRGGKGVKCYKINEKTGNVVGIKAVNENHEIMLISTQGIVIRLACKDISKLGRITSGVKLINVDVANDITVASIAKVRESETEDAMRRLEEEQEENN
jgi:DNA gyrase subunit A